MSAEADRLIDGKRLELRDAFAAHQRSHEAMAQARRALAGIAPEDLTAAQAQLQRLKVEERDAASRFKAISDELAQLHRGKFGEWHITWRGPLPKP